MVYQNADNSFVPLNLTKLKALRKKAGLTMEAAADLAGLAGKPHWSRIESGKISPTIETLERIAAAVGVRAKDLLK